MTRTPAQVLAEARLRDSQKKRARVLHAVDQLIAEGEPITFAAVARTARVSTWLVYAPGMREHIDAARGRQTQRQQRRRSAAATSSVHSLKTDNALLRQDNTALRRERDKLQHALRRRFGQQLDHAAVADTASRAHELSVRNQELTSANRRLVEDNANLSDRLAEAEDELAACRESLRATIRSVR